MKICFIWLASLIAKQKFLKSLQSHPLKKKKYTHKNTYLKKINAKQKNISKKK